MRNIMSEINIKLLISKLASNVQLFLILNKELSNTTVYNIEQHYMQTKQLRIELLKLAIEMKKNSHQDVLITFGKLSIGKQLTRQLLLFIIYAFKLKLPDLTQFSYKNASTNLIASKLEVEDENDINFELFCHS
jgi:hypothetical protein